jgi:hypothetical protein
VTRVNTLNDGVQNNKTMTVTNQNLINEVRKRGSGFHHSVQNLLSSTYSWMDVKKNCKTLIWILMMKGSLTVACGSNSETFDSAAQ